MPTVQEADKHRQRQEYEEETFLDQYQSVSYVQSSRIVLDMHSPSAGVEMSICTRMP